MCKGYIFRIQQEGIHDRAAPDTIEERTCDIFYMRDATRCYTLATGIPAETKQNCAAAQPRPSFFNLLEIQKSSPFSLLSTTKPLPCCGS